MSLASGMGGRTEGANSNDWKMQSEQEQTLSSFFLEKLPSSKATTLRNGITFHKIEPIVLNM